MKKIFSWILISLYFSLSFAQISLNEGSNRNVDLVADEDGDYPDWIEIYNASSSSINLLDYGLTDNINNFSKWTLPAVNIPSHGFLLVYLSGKNRKNPPYLHTNFKITQGGEKVYLADNAGMLLDSLFIGGMWLNESVGKNTNGLLPIKYFALPTPNTSNNSSTGYDGYEPSPTFSVAAGFYNAPVTVALACANPTAQIRYTLDGEEPKITDPLYISPLNITNTKALKAKSFSTTGLLPSKSVTNTYLIGEIIGASVLSITADSVDLYGGIGIIDNWWEDWKKHCYIEYFDTLKVQQFEQHSGIKIDGGAGGSRSRPQRSFRVEPDNRVFGEGVLNYGLFTDKPTLKKFENFYLRNGSNMSNVMPYKDALQCAIAKGTLNTYTAFEPIVVFLNGEYWGMYELREKQDEGFFKYNLGANQDSLDLLSVSYWYGGVLRTVEGSDTGFYAMRDYISNYPNPQTDPNFWANADKKLDLKAYTDYLIWETYMANTDWPYNNIKIWRDRDADKKWRYGLIDFDFSMGEGGWTSPYSDMIDFILNPGTNGHQFATDMFIRLIQNPKFHDYFINRYADIMNTTLLMSRISPLEQKMFDKVNPEMPSQLARWGDGNPVQSQMATFHYYRSRILDDLSVRAPFAREHIRANFQLNKQVNIQLNVLPAGAGTIQISTITPETYPWNGIYFDGVPVTITAKANYGYTFANWSPNTFIAALNNPTFTSNVTDSSTVFTANFTSVPTPQTLVFSEINYNSEPSLNAGDWLEIYNYGNLPINLSNWYVKDAKDNNRFDFPLNRIIQPNQRLVLVEDSALFASVHPNVTNFIGNLGFGLGNDGDSLRLYNPINQLISFVAYQDTFPFPIGTDAEGRTLELKNHLQNLNNANNWFAGCVGGSPAAAYTPCTGIIFSEINYNSAPNLNMGDWVELRNISNTSIDISNWVFQNKNSANLFIIPSGTVLAPHKNWVLVQDTALFHDWHPTVNNISKPFFFNLEGKEEWIRMYDTNGKLKLSVIYDNTAPYPASANGQKYSLEVLDSVGLMNEAVNWFTGCEAGSPGAYYSTPCAYVLANDNWIKDFDASIYPNPVQKEAILSLNVADAQIISIRLLDVNSRELLNIQKKEVFAGKNEIPFSLENFANGIYFIEIAGSNGRMVQKIVKE